MIMNFNYTNSKAFGVLLSLCGSAITLLALHNHAWFLAAVFGLITVMILFMYFGGKE